MNKVLKKVLGFASASVLTAVMVLAVSPVQASDVDARIQALERELVQLKQNQEATEERTLAAEMKGPSFKYAAGKGLDHCRSGQRVEHQLRATAATLFDLLAYPGQS